MDFVKILKEKQRELMLSTTDFANYLGVHRTWLFNKYSATGRKYPLRETTMQHLHSVLGIPYEVMDNYNENIKNSKETD